MSDNRLRDAMESVVERHLQKAIGVYQNLPEQLLRESNSSHNSIVTGLICINRRIAHFFSTRPMHAGFDMQKDASPHEIVAEFIELQERLLLTIRMYFLNPKKDDREVNALVRLVLANEIIFSSLSA